MRRLNLEHGGIVAVTIVLSMACTGPGPEPESEQPQSATSTLFEGARLLVGDGDVIENAAFVVEDGAFTAVGPAGQVDAPEGASRVDLTGRTVMPAIVDAHVHLGATRGALLEDLERRAYFGVGGAMSLGLDDEGAPLEMRDEEIPGAARYRSAGRGITAPEPGRSEVPHWVTTEEEARQAVRDEVERDVDMIKIWVDDRNDQYEKLGPELYRAIIDEAHANDVRVAAHIFDLEDAKGLLRAGVDAFAHGVRDQDVDDELVALVTERPSVVLVPNLPGRGVPVDLEWLRGALPEAELEELRAANTERPEAQASFAIQARNLERLSDEGMTIALGTDGNTPWAPHVEMEDMVAAGMAPGDVIVAATRNAAALADLPEMGTIEEGKSADFIVLEASPLDDITNTRRIVDVYLRGQKVEREGSSSAVETGTSGQ